MRSALVLLLLIVLSPNDFAFVQVARSEGQIPWQLYHKTDEVIGFFKKTALKVPNRVRFEEIPDPKSDTSLPLVTITDFATGEAGKEVLLLVAGEHARELITSEVVFWLGKLLTGAGDELSDWAAIQSVTAAAWRRGWARGTLLEWAEEVLKKVVFKIIPVENIQGRKAVEAGELCLRKSASGVDLNRNWEYAWKEAAAGSDEYGGPAPFSEPEARIVRLVAETSRPQAFVNLHSGEWAVYVPWDSAAEQAPNLPADTPQLLDKLNEYCECMHGAAGAVAGYLAHGSSMDYMYEKLKVQYPITIEVYGPNGVGKLAEGGHPRRLHSSTAAASMQQSSAERLQWQVPGWTRGDIRQLAGVAAAGSSAEERRDVYLKGVASARAGAKGLRAKSLQEAAGGAAAERCFADYNPVAGEEYEGAVATWVAATLVLADHLAAHPGASVALAHAEQAGLPKPKSPPTKQDLARLGQQAEEQHPDNFRPTVAEKTNIDWLPSALMINKATQRVLEGASGERGSRYLVLVALGALGALAAWLAWLRLRRSRPGWASPMGRRGPLRRGSRHVV